MNATTIDSDWQNAIQSFCLSPDWIRPPDYAGEESTGAMVRLRRKFILGGGPSPQPDNFSLLVQRKVIKRKDTPHRIPPSADSLRAFAIRGARRTRQPAVGSDTAR